jgi:hypothetical protein
MAGLGDKETTMNREVRAAYYKAYYVINKNLRNLGFSDPAAKIVAYHILQKQKRFEPYLIRR